MSPAPVRIRRATESDAPVLAGNNRAMARETEDRELAPGVIEAGVLAALTKPELGADYWVAEADGRIAGQTMVTREWSDWRNGWFWWIQSVYVAPEFRRKGVYRALHDHVRTEAEASGDVIGIRLYVERDNRAARATYEALGMHATDYELYETDWS